MHRLTRVCYTSKLAWDIARRHDREFWARLDSPPRNDLPRPQLMNTIGFSRMLFWYLELEKTNLVSSGKTKGWNGKCNSFQTSSAFRWETYFDVLDLGVRCKQSTSDEVINKCGWVFYFWLINVFSFPIGKQHTCFE